MVSDIDVKKVYWPLIYSYLGRKLKTQLDRSKHICIAAAPASFNA